MLTILLQATSNVLSASYAVPSPYSIIVAIVILALTIWIGFVFLKSIIKVIAVLIVLYLLASIGYGFLTTGQLSLNSIASFTTSILSFFKIVIGAPHVISNVTNSIGNTVNPLK